MKDKNLITIMVFNTVIDAHIVGAKLESAGIECYYIGENISSLYPAFSSMMSGVQLQIKHEDLISAQEVLRD